MKKNMKIMAAMTVACVASAANAQTSTLYLTNIDFDRLQAYQGGNLQWDELQNYGEFESPIAVVNNSIRTIGHYRGQLGGNYNLSGRDSGVFYTNPTSSGRFFDSTSDGNFNYLVSFDTGDVYSTSTDYTGATLLFRAGGDRQQGITYDPTNDSLWISNGLGGQVTEYALDGTVLSSFNSGLPNQSALALDHADGTLWLVNQATTTASQFDKNGNLMGSFFSSDLQGVFGGEFMIPAPGSLALLGLGGLAATRRRRT